jgi:hypothetical protein
MKTVDSKKQKLNIADIVMHDSETSKSDVPMQQLIPALIQELNNPNCASRQIGNSLFILHKGEDGKGFFRGLNADTAENYIDNIREFLIWAKEDLGMTFLMTQFKGQEIARITKYFKKHPPIPGMQHVMFNMSNGETRLVLLLEPMKD